MLKTSYKNKWNTVSFGDVVVQVKDRVVREKTGLKYYLGGEHFDNGEIHIRRKGVIEENPIGSAFHMRFKVGHMLLVSRNPHLRKASLAKFEGICANTTYVCEAIKEKLLSSFLPFVMQSDIFWYSAEVNKRGSTNPYLNWVDFAKFQFKLPPLDEQKRLADLLWSVDEATERKREMCKSLANFYNSFLEETCKEAKVREKRSINDICNINKNNLHSNTDPEYEFRYLDITGIVGSNMVGVLEKYFFKNAPSRARRLVEKGNIVLSLVRPYHQAFVLIEEDCKDLIASTGTAVLEVSKKVDRDYLFHIFFSRNFLQFCEQRMTGTNYPAITPTDLKQYKVFLPLLKEQGLISKKLSLIKKIEKDIGREIENLVNIKKQIINQIFG